MNSLRTAAVVMFAIAAIDAVIDGVEYLAGRLTGSDPANLWPVLVGTGIALIIVELLSDKRSFLGRKCHDGLEWIGAKLRRMLDFTAATTFGSARALRPGGTRVGRRCAGAIAAALRRW